MNPLPTTVRASDLEGARWFTSSYSNNGGACVEAAHWFTSSYSNNGGECVEAALGDRVAIRDSKNPTGPALLFGNAEFTAFLTTLRTHPLDG